MKKIILFISIIYIGKLESYKHADRSLLQSMGLSYKQQLQYLNIIKNLQSISIYDQIQAAKKALPILQKNIGTKKTYHRDALQEDRGPIELSIQIIEHQTQHLIDFIRIASYHLSLQNFIRGFIKELWQLILTTCKSMWHNKEYYTSIEQMSRQIIMYTQIEQHICLFTYERALHYFVFIDRNPLPEVINFWEYRPFRFSLLESVRYYTSIPKAQAGLLEAGGAAIATNSGRIVEVAAGAAQGTNAAAQAGMQGVSLLKNTAGETIGVSGPLGRNTIQGLTEGLFTAMGAKTVALLESVSRSLHLIRVGQPADQAIITTARSNATALTANAEIATSQIVTNLATVGITTVAKDVESVTNMLKAANGAILPSNLKIFEVAPAATAPKFIGPSGEALTQSQFLAKTTVVFDSTRASFLTEELLAKQMAAMQIGKNALRSKALIALKPEILKVQSMTNAQISTLERVLATTPKTSPQYGELVTSIEALKGFSKGLPKAFSHTIYASQFATRHPYITIVIELTAQIEVMVAGEMAVHWVQEERAKEYFKLQQEYSLMVADFQTQLGKIQATTSDAISFIENITAAQLNTLDSQRQMLNSIAFSQKTSLLQSIMHAKFAQNYVSNPMIWDQYFLYAPMFTPGPTGTIQDLTVAALNTYKPPLQTFYQGSWTISPVIQSQNLQGTAAWSVSNNIYSLAKPQTSSLLTNIIHDTKMPLLPQPTITNSIPHAWYNVSRRGDWRYDATTNSFIQNQAYPNSSTNFPQGGDPEEAEDNAIFTEFYPQTYLDASGSPFYVLQADIIIKKGTNPWIAGIKFNQGRWISGVTTQTNQYRFCGLYGAQDGTISFCAGETFFITDTTQNTSPNPITPLTQILKPEQQKAWDNATASLIANPLYPNNEIKNSLHSLSIGVPYRITIATQPTQITISLQEKKGDGTLENILAPILITNRNPIIFNYHALGFIASGCSAQFTLLQPHQLVYTKQEIDTFIQQSSSPKAKT